MKLKPEWIRKDEIYCATPVEAIGESIILNNVTTIGLDFRGLVGEVVGFEGADDGYLQIRPMEYRGIDSLRVMDYWATRTGPTAPMFTLPKGYPGWDTIYSPREAQDPPLYYRIRKRENSVGGENVYERGVVFARYNTHDTEIQPQTTAVGLDWGNLTEDGFRAIRRYER